MPQKITVPVFSSLADPALADLIRGGAVGVLLTDTVYGLVGSARDPETARRVIDAKGRKNKPGTLVAANVGQLVELGISRAHLKAAEPYWPGAVSVVLPSGPEFNYLHIGLLSLAVRIPDKEDFRDLLEAVGPLLTTSANRPGEPMVTGIGEAQEIFGNRLDFYVDSGRLPNPVASTIIRVDNDTVEILRQGAVTIGKTTPLD